MRENLLQEASIVDTYIVFKFLKKLTTPFDKMDAFKLGIIDDKGKILIKKSNFGHKEQFDAMTLLDRVVINLKKLMAKFPGGGSKIASYAAALWLIREQKNFKEYLEEPELMYESVYDHMAIIMEDQKEELRKLFEDAPTTNVGGGDIAGTGHDGNDPLVPKKAKKKILKRKTFGDFVEKDNSPKSK